MVPSSTTISALGHDPQPREAARGQSGRSYRGDPRYLRNTRPDSRGPSFRSSATWRVCHGLTEARSWTHLPGIQGGIGVRGPGEKQLEEDRRLVGHRIQEPEVKLGKIQARKEREVASRNDVPNVSLVGYTNAGKSTLMNALTDAGVFVEDKLFATLDTRTRAGSSRAGGMRSCRTRSGLSATCPTRWSRRSRPRSRRPVRPTCFCTLSTRPAPKPRDRSRPSLRLSSLSLASKRTPRFWCSTRRDRCSRPFVP